MSSDYDPSEFVDADLEQRKPSYSPASQAGVSPASRAPTREDVDSRVTEAHQKLASLKRAQEELEREKAALEETRRRRAEFETGRQEMVQQLTRGVGLLEEAEMSARRDAEQMSKSLAGFKDALIKIQSVREESWTDANFQVELTRALTTLENARMEWNAARLKFSVLSTPIPVTNETKEAPENGVMPMLGGQTFGDLCRLGFALTWPVAAVLLLACLGILVLLLRG